MERFDERQLHFDPEKFRVDDSALDADVETRGGALTPEQARAISLAARAAFEARAGDGASWEEDSPPGWFEDYLRLIDMGWPWRVAAYIAWASSPRRDRQPPTLEKLAREVLGLTSPRVIYEWRSKYAALDATVAMMQAAPLFEHRRDVLEALVEMARKPDYKSFNDRKLFLEMVGDYTPRSKLEVEDGAGGLEGMADAELYQAAGLRQAQPAGLRQAQPAAGLQEEGADPAGYDGGGEE